MPVDPSTALVDAPPAPITSSSRQARHHRVPGPLAVEQSPDKSAPSLWRTGAVVLALALTALAWRAPWLLHATRTLDGDEAVTGLMALDILDGARPLYYYGQGYLGSIEPFTAAGLFATFGTTATVLRLAPLLLWIASLGLQYLVVRHWFGRTVAGWSVLLWCAVPGPVALWTVKARGGFTAVMLFGMALTWIYQRGAATSAAGRRPWLLSAGVVLGLGWWTNAMVVYYLLPLAILVGRRIAAAERRARVESAGTGADAGAHDRPGPLTARRWLGAVIPFAVGLGAGLIPVLVYRLSPSALPSRQLFDPTAAGWIAGASRLGGDVLPLLFDIHKSPLAVAAAVLLTATLALSIGGAVRARRLPHDAGCSPQRLCESDGRLYLGLLWLTVPALALVSNQVIDVHGFRYLLPLYSAVSISLAVICVAAARSRSWRRPVGLALAVAWIAHCATSVAAHRNDTVPDLPAEDIARAAETAGVEAVAAPYWQCYRLGFLTDQRLACVPSNGPVRGRRALERWRQQRVFAAVLPNDLVGRLLADAQAASSPDRVERFPVEGWTLVVVRPDPRPGWEERKGSWLQCLVQLHAEQSSVSPGWPALR